MVHHTASVTPHNICRPFDQLLCDGPLLIQRCSLLSLAMHACFVTSDVLSFRSLCSFYPFFFLCARPSVPSCSLSGSALSLSGGDGTCANFHLSLRTYPSPPPPLPKFILMLFLYCLFPAAVSHRAVNTQVLLTDCLLFSCTAASFLLASGCPAGKLCYSSFSPFTLESG